MEFVYRTTSWNQSFLFKEVRSSRLLQLALSLTQLVLSIISDLICAAFPILFLRNLQIKMRTKVALCTLMGLGVMYDKLSLKDTKSALVLLTTGIAPPLAVRSVQSYPGL